MLFEALVELSPYVSIQSTALLLHLLLDGFNINVIAPIMLVLEAIEPTREILQRYYPNVKITREMEEYEGPLSNKKIRDVLGFKDEHDW
jgi:hypothetical protein